MFIVSNAKHTIVSKMPSSLREKSTQLHHIVNTDYIYIMQSSVSIFILIMIQKVIIMNVLMVNNNDLLSKKETITFYTVS